MVLNDTPVPTMAFTDPDAEFFLVSLGVVEERGLVKARAPRMPVPTACRHKLGELVRTKGNDYSK